MPPSPKEVEVLTHGWLNSEFYKEIFKPRLNREIQRAFDAGMSAQTGEQALAWAKFALALREIETLWIPEWLGAEDPRIKLPGYGDRPKRPEVE